VARAYELGWLCNSCAFELLEETAADSGFERCETCFQRLSAALIDGLIVKIYLFISLPFVFMSNKYYRAC